MREAAASSRIADVTPKTTAPPDAKALHQFAEQYWNGNDEAVRRAIAKVTELRPVLTPILHEQGVPDEIAALVLVESAGQPTALSPKGARGIWQFMPDTARRYGLVVTPDVDERTEVVKSTVAAAHYLHDLYQRFGDWRLAFAAYNAGEQAVERAVARTENGDFLRIDGALPEETRNYVPAVMRAMELLGSNKQEILPLLKSEKSPVRSVLYASTESAD
jgi:membrane-bound lytic murein transglycosylase D